jgi:maltose phosphorylase
MYEKYLETNEWKIIERSWNAANHPKSESIFSLGNGRMGQRANFEEDYSGKSLQGSYIAGVYYPDKTKVGWWKNGYPEYFAKVLNSVNWIGLRLEFADQKLDLNTAKVTDFYRELNMREGYLLRSFTAELADGKQVKVEVTRFLSIVQDEIGAIRYQFTPLNFSGEVKITNYLDFDVKNEDSNYDEKFWEEVEKNVASQKGLVTARTKKTGFVVSAAMRYALEENGKTIAHTPQTAERLNYVENVASIAVNQGTTYTIYKYAAVVSSLNYAEGKLLAVANEKVEAASKAGFDTLFAEHSAAWIAKWATSDIIIDGDPEAQQGIRFNIFQLNQTFTGVDARLNIGPKGFTGEKYGGSTYWDTEAYCLPFYLASSESHVARNLLLYRYKQLGKAIENAEKLGFTNGAALYPMVTMNGEECHNEWEITFEEIHRNGAIAFGIFNYVRHTGDREYLADYGLEVLIAISRFWTQRVNWSAAKQKYVMLGVTGPNEYENNVNNNWYTNKIATWTLEWTMEVIALLREEFPEKLADVIARTNFKEAEKVKKWTHIIQNMYFPYDPEKQVFLQQEGFLDKEQLNAADLDPAERPINQHWSWDRILRSIFIKQADVLQGMYFFEHHYDKASLRRNFDFYEPKTVHESSLSPCVHVILASRIGYQKKAYEMYLRTARLDLDDYNHEVHEGLHITSMAGTWMSVVQGFGGMRIIKSKLHFEPALPEQWNKFTFTLLWRGARLVITIFKDRMEVANHGTVPAEFGLFARLFTVAPSEKQIIPFKE